MEEKSCKCCGKKFVTSNKRKIFCSRLCERRNRDGNKPDLMRQGNRFTTDLGCMNRVQMITSRFEYIGNDGSGDDRIYYLMCKDCGNIVKKSSVGFKPSHRHLITCTNCDRIFSEKRKRDEQDLRQKRAQEVLALRQIRQELRQEQKESERKARIKTYTCERCGKEFRSLKRRKYCSKECGDKQRYSDKEHRRRIRCMSQKHDSISLKVLATRDKDRCWICGRRVDWNDCELRENNIFIAFNNYPSIDHVMPLSKGGTHTWDNVRLAHRRYNTKKKDKLTIEESSGQLRLIV